MIIIKFGLPGSGKTTDFAKTAYNARKHYKNVYGNVHMSIPDYTYIDDTCIGTYQLENGIVLIDEATLLADNRDFKSMSKALKQFLVLHRHYKLDLVFYVQKWDAVDIKIRTMCDQVYYIRKSLFLGKWISYEYRIPYGLEFSNPKTDGHRYGEIVMGYSKPRFMDRVFKGIIIRPLYYKYFDSWEAPELLPLPPIYTTNPHKPTFGEWLFNKLHKK